MKEIIKNYVILVLEAFFVVFCVGYIWTGQIGAGKGLAGGIGDVLEDVEKQDLRSETHLLLNDVVNAKIPVVKYVGGTKQVGEFVAFKEMVEVCLFGESFTNGAEEKGFYIYFGDIQDEKGNSVVVSLKTEEIEALEEIPAAFIFDREKGILYFHKSGIFMMHLMIYTEDEIGTDYECMLPVETS